MRKSLYTSLYYHNGIGFTLGSIINVTLLNNALYKMIGHVVRFVYKIVYNNIIVLNLLILSSVLAMVRIIPKWITYFGKKITYTYLYV